MSGALIRVHDVQDVNDVLAVCDVRVVLAVHNVLNVHDVLNALPQYDMLLLPLHPVSAYLLQLQNALPWLLPRLM